MVNNIIHVTMSDLFIQVLTNVSDPLLEQCKNSQRSIIQCLPSLASKHHLGDVNFISMVYIMTHGDGSNKSLRSRYVQRSFHLGIFGMIMAYKGHNYNLEQSALQCCLLS